MLYKGSQKIKDTGSFGVYKGSQAIRKIYKGSELVYLYSPFNTNTVLINYSSSTTQSRLVVAGCGGSFGNQDGSGGNGGRTTGQAGQGGDGKSGGGGTQSAGGSGGAAGFAGSSGAAGKLGLGGNGSSYANSSRCSSVTHTQGYRNGTGYITITTRKK